MITHNLTNTAQIIDYCSWEDIHDICNFYLCFTLKIKDIISISASPYMQVVMPYNFTVGISDSSVFDIPDICKPSSLVGK
jgi:hypothetical protein